MNFMLHLEKIMWMRLQVMRQCWAVWCRDGEDAYRMLDESIYTSELGIAFKKGTHKEVAQELTETLEEMRNEGITEEIVTKVRIGCG